MQRSDLLKVLELGRAGTLLPGPLGFLTTLEERKEGLNKPVDLLILPVSFKECLTTRKHSEHKYLDN